MRFLTLYLCLMLLLKCVLVTQLCLTLAVPWTVVCQTLFMEFSRQEYWSGLPFPSPGDLPHPGIEPGSPALQANLPGTLLVLLLVEHKLREKKPFCLLMLNQILKNIYIYMPPITLKISKTSFQKFNLSSLNRIHSLQTIFKDYKIILSVIFV